MHIARHTPEELVVVAGTRWISAICAGAALITGYFALSKHQSAVLFLVGFFLLFTFLMDLRKTFTFDATQRVLRWRGRKLFKSESGEIPFDSIIDIGTETRRAGTVPASGVPVCRLTVVTAQRTVPMSYTFSGHADGYAALRTKILDFLRANGVGPTALIDAAPPSGE